MIPAALLKATLAVLTRLVMSLCGEKIIEWFIFKVCEFAVKSTKTPCDDEFYLMVKDAYEKSKERDNAIIG